MSAIRPLPARFSLEFEKKAAKAFLRRLHNGDAEALARLRGTIGAIGRAPADLKLADAQLVIAREYGFASWPRLVRYFEDAERQSFRIGESGVIDGIDHLEQQAQSHLRGLARQHRATVRMFAAYVPRFYAAPLEEVVAAQATPDEARLVVARSHGFPSWQVLVAEAAALKQRIARRERTGRLNPMALNGAAQRGELDQLLDKYPDQLNEFLCGGMGIQPETVQFLLDRGADPNHVMPNGIPVLEYALIRYWNGRAVDVLAARARPRRALWIAAGLGDVAGVAGFLDSHGKPTREAHLLRPDWVAAGLPVTSLPDASDEEILMETLLIASCNARGNVIEYLAARGLDVDCLFWGSPILGMAAGNGWLETVESLLRAGANPDLRGERPDWTPRDYAREMITQLPDDPVRQRIADLLGVKREG